MIFKRLILVFLFFVGIISVNKETFADTCTPPFTDVPCDHWAINYISAIKNAGITTGYPDGTFWPENPVKRSEMAVFIIRAVEGEPTNNNTNPYFADVDPTHWAFRYVQRLREIGVTTGYPTTPPLYGPDDNVTREQMAVMLIRALAYQGMTDIPPDDYCSSGSPFHDVEQDRWSCKFIKRLRELNITSGYPDGRFKPENPVTRAEMATFIYRSFGLNFEPTSLIGTAATGKALVSTAIYLKDAKGNIKSTITDKNGKFSFDTTYLTPPFYLRTQGFGLFSYTEQKNGTANITPLTTAVVAIANNGNPDVYNNPPSQLNLDNAKNSLKNLIDPVLQKYDAQNVDFIASPFEANGQGMDKVLDTIFISVDKDIKTIEIKNPFTGETIGTGTIATGAVIVNDPITSTEVNNLTQSPSHRKYFVYLMGEGPRMMDVVYDIDGKMSVTITSTEGDTGDIFFIYGSGQRTGNNINFTASVILCNDKCENEQDPNCNPENNRGNAVFNGTIDDYGNISGTFVNTMSSGFVCKQNNSSIYEGTWTAEDVTNIQPANVDGVYDVCATPAEWEEECKGTLEVSQTGNEVNVSITAIEGDTGQPFTRIGKGTSVNGDMQVVPTKAL